MRQCTPIEPICKLVLSGELNEEPAALRNAIHCAQGVATLSVGSRSRYHLSVGNGYRNRGWHRHRSRRRQRCRDFWLGMQPASCDDILPCRGGWLCGASRRGRLLGTGCWTAELLVQAAKDPLIDGPLASPRVTLAIVQRFLLKSSLVLQSYWLLLLLPLLLLVLCPRL